MNNLNNNNFKNNGTPEKGDKVYYFDNKKKMREYTVNSINNNGTYTISEKGDYFGKITKKAPRKNISKKIGYITPTKKKNETKRSYHLYIL